MNNEKEFYNKISNWNFSDIKCTKESLTNWNLYEELKKFSNKDSKILDLGTGGGEKVLKYFPEVKEILGTDYSPKMIETANSNLTKSTRKNITFRVMDNLKMDTKDDYYDIVVARHTCINANQIYKTLKNNGKLIVRGVDKLDCWNLKMLFGKGQGYEDKLPISLIDYENIIKAGFKNVELVPIHEREYYETREDLIALLLKTPIISNFDEDELDLNLVDKYIEESKTDKGILLIRRYYGITATKNIK